MQNIYRNILFHIPHNSERFPFWIKNQFVLSPYQMRNELILMTDYKTNALFSFTLHQKKLVAKVSWLVVDVERFADDGTDNFHTSKKLLDAAQNAFYARGFEVGINTPFACSIVPLEFYKKDERVQSIMIEVRRDLYMNEKLGKLNKDWRSVKRKINSACREICGQFQT